MQFHMKRKTVNKLSVEYYIQNEHFATTLMRSKPLKKNKFRINYNNSRLYNTIFFVSF